MSNRAVPAAPPDQQEQERVARLWPLLIAVIGSRDPRLAAQLKRAHYGGLDGNRRLRVEQMAAEAIRYAQSEGRLNVLWSLSLLLGEGYDVQLSTTTSAHARAAPHAYRTYLPAEPPASG